MNITVFQGEDISNGALPDGKDAMSIFSSAPKAGKDLNVDNACIMRCVLCAVFDCLVCVFLDDDSPQDDEAAKAQNPPLTRETDLVVLISDLENIFDEDEEELGVRNI